MKTLTSLFAAMLLAVSLPAAADSRHDRYGGHHPQQHHRHHGSPPGWAWGAAGLALGGLLFSIEAPRPAPIVVQPARPPGRMWYWCESYQGYYPYVQHCPEGWRAVPAY